MLTLEILYGLAFIAFGLCFESMHVMGLLGLCAYVIISTCGYVELCLSMIMSKPHMQCCITVIEAKELCWCCY
jgi:hypothetical protein